MGKDCEKLDNGDLGRLRLMVGKTKADLDDVWKNTDSSILMSCVKKEKDALDILDDKLKALSLNTGDS